MGDDPIVALFDKNHREAGWLWHEFALAVTHEIVETDCQYGCGIDHPQLLLHELDLVAGADYHSNYCVIASRPNVRSLLLVPCRIASVAYSLATATLSLAS